MTGTRPFHCALSVCSSALETSLDRFLGREDHMTQEAALEFPEVLEIEQYLGECSPSPSVTALNGTPRSIQRSELRAHLSTPMWLTSLRRPGVLEVVPTENISRTGTGFIPAWILRPRLGRLLQEAPERRLCPGSLARCAGRGLDRGMRDSGSLTNRNLYTFRISHEIPSVQPIPLQQA